MFVHMTPMQLEDEMQGNNAFLLPNTCDAYTRILSVMFKKKKHTASTE